jgi:signal transduction histidine kinase
MVEPKDVNLFETMVPLIGLAVIIALGVILMVHQFQRSLFRRRLNEESLKMEHQRELLRTAIAIQEQERQRIAGDLHDELGAQLSMTLLLLRQSYKAAPEQTNEQLALLQQLEEHLKEALSSTKRISYELMPPQLVNLGLQQALLVLVEDARKAGNLDVKLLRPVPGEELPWAVQLGLYRMLSELLNNTLKYAAATEVSIELQEADGRLTCYYRDNGKGLPEIQQGQGLGLRNLEGRTTALNGTFVYGNATEGGFFAKISIPTTA